MAFNLNEKEEVEVVLKKNMTMENYKNLIAKSKKQGWKVQAFQIGIFTEPMNKKVE